MPVRELACPVCGTDVTMGLPLGTTVETVTDERRPVPDDEGRKRRTLACPEGHEFAVVFAV